MTDLATKTLDLGLQSRRPRVDTLVRLRWLAVSGQMAAVLATYYLFGFPMPIKACLFVVFASIWVNIALRLRFSHNHRLADRTAAALSAYDLLQLTVLLYLTGGLENPFSMLFLAPLMITAVTLSAVSTVTLTLPGHRLRDDAHLLSLADPVVPGRDAAPAVPLSDRLLGCDCVGCELRGGLCLARRRGGAPPCRCAGRDPNSFSRVSSISRSSMVSPRRRLTNLEPPLATIKLVVRDLQKQFPTEGPIGEDLSLLMQEAERCRKILGTLTSLGGSEPGDIIGTLTLSHLIEEVVHPQRDFGIHIAVVKEGVGPEPTCTRNPGVLYGLGNLVENAIDFAATEVRIVARDGATP